MIKPLLTAKQILRAIISVAGMVVLLCVYYFGFVNPLYRQIKNQQSGIIKIKNDAEKNAGNKLTISDLRLKIDELKAAKNTADKKFLREKEIPPLTRTVNNIAAKYKVDVRVLNVPKTEQIGHFVKADCNITAVGDYAEVKKFLSDLASEGCLIQNTEMVVIIETSDNLIIKLSVTLVYYRYNE